MLGQAVTSAADDIFINVFHRPGIQGNRNATLQLDVPTFTDNVFLGGENMPIGGALGSLTAADLQINEVDSLPGTISFSSASYLANEGGANNNVAIQLFRTGGSSGTISVIFNTTNGTALAGTDYVGVTNTVTFQQGVTNKTVLVAIKGNSLIQPDRTLRLVLRNPTGGSTVGLGEATMTIIDDDFLAGRLSTKFMERFTPAEKDKKNLAEAV